jgi:Ca2+-transporting ATPase
VFQVNIMVWVILPGLDVRTRLMDGLWCLFMGLLFYLGNWDIFQYMLTKGKKKMKYYLERTEDVFRETASGAGGLTQAEAEKRLDQNGKNRLAEVKKDSLIKRFFAQMADPMIIILIAAAVVSGITSIYSGEGIADVIIILFVVIVNAALGVYQENKAEKAIEALQEMSAATSKVMRDGAAVLIRSEDIVVGDVCFT